MALYPWRLEKEVDRWPYIPGGGRRWTGGLVSLEMGERGGLVHGGLYPRRWGKERDYGTRSQEVGERGGPVARDPRRCVREVDRWTEIPGGG